MYVGQAIRRREDRPIESILGRYTTEAAYRESERLLEELASARGKDPDFATDQARALWCAAQLLQRPEHLPEDSDVEPNPGPPADGLPEQAAWPQRQHQ